MDSEHAKQTAALYWEICFLRRLLRLGVIDRAAFDGICRIAAEESGVRLPSRENCV